MRRAFTLVELLVAMALGTLLMVSLMGLAARLPAAAEAMDAGEQTPAWVGPTFEALRRDLARAREIRPGKGWVELEMPISLPDAPGQSPRATRVTWAVRPVAGASALVRTESCLVAGTRKVLGRDLAAMDVSGFAVAIEGRKDKDGDASDRACATLSITDAASGRTFQRLAVLR